MKKSVTILGFGISGRAAAKLASKQGYKIQVLDEGISQVPEDDAGAYNFITDATAPMPDSELIIASPGIPLQSDLMKKAISTGIPLISELEFGYRHCKSPILAITGTNGKTTTTELTAHLLNALGYNAVTVGNIGNPLSAMVCDSHPEQTVFVAEVSSFQLELPTCNTDFTFKPFAAALLNTSSDHQDRYPSFKDYEQTKFRLFLNMNSCKHAIINENLLPSWQQQHNGKPVTFGNIGNAWSSLGTDIYYKESLIVKQDRTMLPGRHNAENIMAVFALIQAFCGNDAITDSSLKQALYDFQPAAHRLETFLEKDGIQYINDSKSTNPDSTIAALNAMGKSRNVCLILGGLDKDMDFSPLTTSGNTVKKAFIIGQCKDKIASAIDSVISYELHATLEAATKAAQKEAVKGDIILLSPACASRDMFTSYKARGDKFKAICLSS